MRHVQLQLAHFLGSIPYNATLCAIMRTSTAKPRRPSASFFLRSKRLRLQMRAVLAVYIGLLLSAGPARAYSRYNEDSPYASERYQTRGANRAGKIVPRPVRKSAPMSLPGAARTPPSKNPAANKKAAVANDDDDEVEVIDEVQTKSEKDLSGPSTWWGDAYPLENRILDALTPRTVRKHTFNTLITHRNNGGWLRDPFQSLFGFDKGALKVGLALRFGILDNLDIGALRVNGTIEVFDTYEFDARWNILQQDKFAIDLAVRAGLTWFAQPRANDAVGAMAQFMLGRLIANRVYLGASLLYHSSSSGPVKSNKDISSSAALQIYGDFRLTGGFAWPVELTYAIAGYRLPNPILTTGPKWMTNRHSFAIVLSNSQYFTGDGLITNSNRFNPRDWVLGFHITREL